MKKTLFAIGLMFVLLMPVFSEALPVPIVNPGFENQVLTEGGWTSGVNSISGWNSYVAAGIWNPTDFVFFSTLVPEGNNVAFSNGDNITTQIVDYQLQPNTELTLSVDVGWRFDTPFPGYAIQLWANNNVLASSSAITPAQGTFATSTLSYLVTDTNPFLGSNLTIALVSYGVQTVFDNVRLTNDPINSVPEPSTLLLLGSGLLGFGIFARKRRK